MTPNTTTGASSLWQYINDSMEQYGSLDLTSKPKAPIVAGVGLVLDTRQQDAIAAVKKIEKEMSEMQGEADQTRGEVRSCVRAAAQRCKYSKRRPAGAVARLRGVPHPQCQSHVVPPCPCICLLQELQEVGASQNPALTELHHRLGKARVELQAAKEEDGVVVSRQHVEGAAFKSGRIRNGDIICKVDGVPVGE